MTTITLTHLSLFGQWTRELVFDTCSICKESINDTAPLVHFNKKEPVNHFAEDASGHSLRVGACGHVFHTHCLTRWLERRPVCPLCNATWDTCAECV